MKTTRTVRSITVLAATGAAVFAAPAFANASPIDFQPTPLGCPGGIGVAHTVTETEDDDAVDDSQLQHTIEQDGSNGGQINWVNLSTMQTGAGALAAADGEGKPAALLDTGAGTVASVVWGAHTNGLGENCFLLPGVDVSNVPADDDPIED